MDEEMDCPQAAEEMDCPHVAEEMDCPHVADAAMNLIVDVNKTKQTLSNRSCNVCLRGSGLWICMECMQIFCGQRDTGHTAAHYAALETHCIFINIESAAILCYKCGSEVEPKNHDDELNRLRQFILYNRGPNKKNPRKRRRKRTVLRKKIVKVTKIVIKNITSKKPIKAPKPKKSTLKRGPRTYNKVGISNSGNNCFMNAVWQAISHLKPFIFCLKLSKVCDNHKANNNGDDSKNNPNGVIAEELFNLLIALVDWVKPAGSKCRDAISPTALHAIVCKIKPRYKGFHQHDAHEFLMFTLDTLHSELRNEKVRLLLEEGLANDQPNEIDTIVSIMFRGYLLSEVLCLNCNTPSNKKDPFTDISLDVPDHKNDAPDENRPVDLLTDCLARYIEVEELNERNFYFCSKCESQQRSTKRFWIHNLPNILCLHLKRFRWDATYRTKVHTHIKFPIHSLDMSQYLDTDMKAIMTKQDENAYLYDLAAVIVHDGEGGGSGHYITYALDYNEKQWYQYNDDKVHEVDVSFVENVQAYILFYLKREIRLNLNI